MKVARIVVLLVALGAGLIAAMLAMRMGAREPEAPQVVIQEAPKVESEQVLVANHEIQTGAKVTGGDFQWQPWPKSSLSDNYIVKSARPNALDELSGSIARSSFLTGEPVREARLLKAERGFMSVILTPGMRAIAVEVKASSTAGGFILPNDRVDIILTHPNANKGASGDATFTSETILTNVRVLAIDQQISENKGESSVVAKNTATLELTPRQSEVLAASQQIGTLSLVLRSLSDASVQEAEVEDNQNGAVTMVRYGIVSKVTTKH